MRYCPAGHEVSDDLAFCQTCGVSLGVDGPPASPPEVPWLPPVGGFDAVEWEKPTPPPLSQPPRGRSRLLLVLSGVILIAAAVTALVVVPKLGSDHDSPEEYCERLIAVFSDGGGVDDDLASHAPDEIRSQAKTLADLATATRTQYEQYVSDHPDRADHIAQFTSWIEINCI